MITFEMRKTKALSMPILVEGIDQGHLKFRFTIEVNNVSYGFPAIQEGDSVKFVIPALDTVIKGLSEGTYKARLEVSALTEGDRGFYMNPWAEEIRVKKSVSIEVQPMKDENKTIDKAEGVKVKTSAMFSEENGVDMEECLQAPIEKPEEKPHKIINPKMREKFI